MAYLRMVKTALGARAVQIVQSNCAARDMERKEPVLDGFDEAQPAVPRS